MEGADQALAKCEMGVEHVNLEQLEHRYSIGRKDEVDEVIEFVSERDGRGQ